MLQSQLGNPLTGVAMLGEGAKPPGEIRPDLGGAFERQDLEEPQGYRIEIDEPLKGLDLRPDLGLHRFGIVGQVEIGGPGWSHGHRLEPEPIGKAAQQVN